MTIFLDEALPASTGAEVDAERDRRIDGGIVFQGLRFQTRPGDRENIAGAAQLAALAILTGGKALDDPFWNDQVDADGQPVPFRWIAEDNSLVPLGPAAVIALGRAAAAAKQAHTFAARTLKDMQPIPWDYAADRWWQE
ncbi:DUF4376 domain-containing protein [Aureimonas leprariae]|uniref:DUF4376 domain-containing protein n=1 Tax=Plantimonas leprariae TaxID=2615207 RepID=A0A7V7PSD6_9HYPH|nr:DUF4376 domain-containing protein [Aureimonas leprariae]KAB0682010.1 DUF4376 domain-containing protein [Aureimonas leprariae]